jgi:hypothetical protein
LLGTPQFRDDAAPLSPRGPLASAARFDLDQPQDDIAQALAGAAHGPQAVDDGPHKPDPDLGLGVGLALVADGAERGRRGDGVEGGGGYGEADYNYGMILPTIRPPSVARL